MEVVTHSIIKGSRDRFIFIDAFLRNDNKPKPVIIFSHGFKGFKDWGHFNRVAQEFAEAGFVFVKFNFSYNGTTLNEPATFADLNAFGENNYTTELDDLEKVMDWVLSNQELSTEINRKQIYLLGHSRGGGISILKAAEDERVTKLVTWAAVGDFVKSMQMYDVASWKEKGVLYVENARTKQEMPLFYQFYEDTQANAERLDIAQKASSLSIPFLIVHGTEDTAVPVENAKMLHCHCKGSTLFLVEGAGHTFEAKHPFEEKELPENAKKVMAETLAFFKA